VENSKLRLPPHLHFEDNISLSQFTHGAMKYDGSGYRDKGTGLSKETVIKCLDFLEKARLIKKVARNNPVANRGAKWALEVDYNSVDMEVLEARLERRKHVNNNRIQKARASKKPSNNIPIDN
jgi:hypothetical protein